MKITVNELVPLCAERRDGGIFATVGLPVHFVVDKPDQVEQRVVLKSVGKDCVAHGIHSPWQGSQ